MSRAVRLLNITPDVERLVTDESSFKAAHGASFGGQGDAICGFTQMTETARARNGAPPEWGGYLAIDPDAARVVGACLFKGSPIDGEVEIAFFTFPPHERRGYATAMAGELVKRCLPAPSVRRILAHTMPEESATTAVLRKNGFTNVGEVADAEDGRVWRWELRK